jgi:hypothetical protein
VSGPPVIVRAVTSSDSILDLIRQDRGLAELLWSVCEFDLTRGDHGEPVSLSSGLPLDGVAGDFTGGTFFLCGDRSTTRPVLYASSEGQAGLVGGSLAEALEIMVGLPCWWDCLKFSGGGDLAAPSVPSSSESATSRSHVCEWAASFGGSVDDEDVAPDQCP